MPITITLPALHSENWGAPLSLAVQTIADGASQVLTGLRSARPAAASVPSQTIYIASDTKESYIQLSSAWVVFGSGGNELAYAEATSSQTIATGAFTEVDVTGLTISFVMPERPVYLTVQALVQSGPGKLITSVTFTDAGDLVTAVAHGAAVGDRVRFGTITSTAGVLANVWYYVLTVPSADTMTLSATLGGATLALTTNGSAASILIDKAAGTDAILRIIDTDAAAAVLEAHQPPVWPAVGNYAQLFAQRRITGTAGVTRNFKVVAVKTPAQTWSVTESATFPAVLTAHSA